jgi:uncharacterized protein YeeX (DUF496 family)
VLSVKALKATMHRQISKVDRGNRLTTDVATDKKKITDNMKEVFLQDISSKTMFDEVYKN